MGNRNDTHEERRHRASASFRGARLEELIREEMNSLLEGEISDERLQGAWITAVELTHDGGRARLWYAVTHDGSSDGSDVHAVLEHASGFFRRRLCDALALKRTPEVRFSRDPLALVVEHAADDEGDAV